MKLVILFLACLPAATCSIQKVGSQKLNEDQINYPFPYKFSVDCNLILD